MTIQPNLQDKRRQKRQLLNGSVQILTESSQANGLGINLSDVGMCLFAIANLPLGSHVQVEFLQPGCNEPVRMCGIVRHRALYLYGIEFLAGGDETRVRRVDADTITSCLRLLSPAATPDI